MPRKRATLTAEFKRTQSPTLAYSMSCIGEGGISYVGLLTFFVVYTLAI